MSTPDIPAGALELIEKVEAEFKDQKWYQEFSNTATVIAGLVPLVIWVAAAAGYDIPASVTVPVTAVIGLLTVLGVIKTKNGITQPQIADLKVKAADTTQRG